MLAKTAKVAVQIPSFLLRESDIVLDVCVAFPGQPIFQMHPVQARLLVVFFWGKAIGPTTELRQNPLTERQPSASRTHLLRV